MKLNLKWVTNAIGEDYKNWRKGDVIKIQAQTGTGKTYFIKTVLIPNMDYERMLIVANRINLKRQLKRDLFDYYNKPMPNTLKELDDVQTIGNVTIMSYQSLNERINADNYNLTENNKLNLDDYKYIICDECHFFLSDGAFNNKCYLSCKELIKGRHRQAIKIFISATMQEVEKSIDKSVNNIQKNAIGTDRNCKLYSYSAGTDYSYLNTSYFKSIKDIALTIKNDKSNDKWLVFVTKKDDGKYIKKTLEGYKSVNIITKDTNINKSPDLQEIINNSKFKSDVLICTKAMDNGINIMDLDVKNIVVMAWDKISFIQELGRLRINIDNAPMINLYITTRSWSAFNTLITKTYEPKINLIEYFLVDKNKFNAEYSHNYNKLPTDIFLLNSTREWTINIIGKVRLDKDNKFAEKMCERFNKDNKFAYVKEQLSWIGQEGTFNEMNLIEDVIDNEDIKSLEQWIEEHLGQRLYSEQQQELSNLIISELTTLPNNIDYRTKTIKPTTLESILREQLNLPYAINKTKREDKIVDGIRIRKNYITITKLI